MANETKNQEFNKSIKQLQSMVKDKMIIGLAEKYFNLKTEMNNLARAVKEKESKLLLEESKQLLEKEKAEKSARMKKTDNPGPIAQTVGSRRPCSLWYAPLSVSHMIH